MKYDTYSAYDSRVTSQALPTFLTIWSAFAEEVRQNNPACSDAVESLHKDFQSEAASGPVKASHFVLGPSDRRESEESKLKRTLIEQDMVNVGMALLKAAE